MGVLLGRCVQARWHSRPRSPRLRRRLHQPRPLPQWDESNPISGMDPLIACDLYRHAGKADFRTFLSCYLRSPGFKFTFAFRMSSKERKISPAWLFYKLLHRRYFFKYGIQIPVKTKIGKGLFISHFGAIVVHNDARLGDNCTLSHGVTIGRTN